LNSGLWTYTVTYPSISSQTDSGKFTITVSGNSGIQPDIIGGSYLYEQLGFEKNSTNSFSVDSITSTNIISINRESTLFIHSDICNNERDNVLQEIYTGGNETFSIINFVNQDNETTSKSLVSNNHNVYRFYLTDEDSNPINLNGLNMILSVTVFKKNPIYN